MSEQSDNVATIAIAGIELRRTAEEDSYQTCKGYLAEYSSSTGRGYYLDRKTGEFKGPPIEDWKNAPVAVKAKFIAQAEKRAAEAPPEVLAGFEDRAQYVAFLAEELFHDAPAEDEVLASKCSREWERRSHPYVVPAQHLPHNKANWSHVPPEQIKEAFQRQADGFARAGIEPTVSDSRTMEFWLDVLQAVQDCERLEAHERGDWVNQFVRVAVELKQTDSRGQIWEKTVESSGIGGVESDSGKDYFNEQAREQLWEIRDELLRYGLTDEQIDDAIVEHLGEECLTEESRRSRKSGGVRR